MTEEKKDPQADGKPPQSFTFFQRLQLSLISWVGWALTHLIGLTLRYRVERRDILNSLEKDDKAIIWSFWHNQILAATYYFRARGIVVITSRHFDGEYIARIIRRLGYGTARGSSTRGAVSALIQLKKHLEKGEDVGFTIDGPKGPVYKVKGGPIWLSRKTGAPIMNFHVEPRRYWQFNSWDGFRVPKPFSTVLVRIGEPVVVPPDGDEQAWLETYQRAMDDLRDYCESYSW